MNKEKKNSTEKKLKKRVNKKTLITLIKFQSSLHLVLSWCLTA